MSYRSDASEAPEEKSFVRKFGLVLLAIGAFVLAKGVGTLIGRTTVERYNEGRQEGQLEAGIAEAAGIIRKQVPIQVDEQTIMTDAVATGREILYMMSVSVDVADADVPAVKASLQESVSRNVCAEERTRALIAAGGTMTYQYHLPTGTSFTVSVNHCAT